MKRNDVRWSVTMTMASLCGALALVLTGCGAPGTRPNAPTKIAVTAGPGAITVSWQDNSDDETGFAVLRSTGGAYEEVAKVPTDTTSYIDTGVTGTAPYTYEVAAIGSGGRSTSGPSAPIRPNVAGVPIVDPSDPIGVSLNKLGIDTTETPRVDENGDPLPSDYAPLGATVTLGLGADPSGVDTDRSDYARYELFIGGAATQNTTTSSNQVVWQNPDAGSPTLVAPMFGLGPSQTLFDVSSADRYGATSGDLDGDGLDEFALVDVTGDQLTVRVRDDAVAGYTESSFAITQQAGVLGLDVMAGDFNGDGTDTLAVALGMNGTAKLLFLDPMASSFTIAKTLTFDASVAGATTTLQLATGNLDDDVGQEVALTINESFQTGGKDDGVSRYAILDDASTGFAQLDGGLVQGQDGSVHNALVSDVAIGNIDADARDEVVFGGITAFHDTCSTYDLLFVALDDALPGADLAPLGAKLRTVSMGGACTASKIKKLRFIHVDTGDVDGDGIDEIVGGPMVFDDFSASGGPWTELGFIPADQMYGHGVNDSAATITDNNSALAITDMDGDGASEVIYFMAHDEAVIRYGLPATAGAALQGRTWFVVDQSLTANGSRFRPMLVPANIDQDSMVAELVPADTTFTMTEPLIIAAIAGAPCYDSISQNVGACGSSYGQGQSTTTTTDTKVTVSASASIGMKATGGAAGAERGHHQGHVLPRRLVQQLGQLHLAEARGLFDRPPRGRRRVLHRAVRPLRLPDPPARRQHAHRGTGEREPPARPGGAARGAELLQLRPGTRGVPGGRQRLPAHGRGPAELPHPGRAGPDRPGIRWQGPRERSRVGRPGRWLDGREHRRVQRPLGRRCTGGRLPSGRGGRRRHHPRRLLGRRQQGSRVLVDLRELHQLRRQRR